MSVNASESRGTKCPSCGKILVDRVWFGAETKCKRGRCFCGEIVPGLFIDADNHRPKIRKVPDEFKRMSNRPNLRTIATRQCCGICVAGGHFEEQCREDSDQSQLPRRGCKGDADRGCLCGSCRRPQRVPGVVCGYRLLILQLRQKVRWICKER